MKRFAFLVHPRNKADVDRYRAIAPAEVDKALRELSPVELVELSYKDATGKVIALPLTTAQLARLPRRYARHKVLEAAQYAERDGADVIGLGAMTSVITRGGLWLTPRVHCLVTNGNALTATTVVDHVLHATECANSGLRVGIIGGGGSVGLCIAQILISSCRELILVGRNSLTLAHAARTLSDGQVRTTEQVQDITDADVIVVATAGPDPVLHMDDVGPNTIVLDLSEPTNVCARSSRFADPRLMKSGRLRLDDLDLSRYDPDLESGVVFACLAETILFALEDSLKDHSVGQLDPLRAKQFARLAAFADMRPSY